MPVDENKSTNEARNRKINTGSNAASGVYSITEGCPLATTHSKHHGDPSSSPKPSRTSTTIHTILRLAMQHTPSTTADTVPRHETGHVRQPMVRAIRRLAAHSAAPTTAITAASPLQPLQPHSSRTAMHHATPGSTTQYTKIWYRPFVLSITMVTKGANQTNK